MMEQSGFVNRTYAFDFARNRYPSWFLPGDQTRQAAVVSYMHAHQLTLNRVFAARGCAKHFCTYRFTVYDDPSAIPGPVTDCGWLPAKWSDQRPELPFGFSFRPGNRVPIIPSIFERDPDPAPPISKTPVPSPRFSGGDGSKDSPFLISSAEDLLLLSCLSNYVAPAGVDPALAASVGNNFREWSRGKHFRLTRDVVWNAPGTEEGDRVPFPMIGNRNSGPRDFFEFAGVFDGGGHSISGLYVSEEIEAARYPGDYNYNCGVSLFGYLQGEIRNLAIVDSFFVGSSRVAPFAGTLVQGGRIENCYSDNRILLSGSLGSRNAGGVVGFSVNGSVSRTVVSGEILGSVYSNVSFLGGILGAVLSNAESATEVSDCYVFARIREAIDPTVRREFPVLISIHRQERVEVVRVIEGALAVWLHDRRYIGTPGTVFVVNPYEYCQVFASPSDAEKTAFQFFAFDPRNLIHREDSPLAFRASDKRRQLFKSMIASDDPGSAKLGAVLDSIEQTPEKMTTAPPSAEPQTIRDELRTLSAIYRFSSVMAENGWMFLNLDVGEEKDARFKAEMIEFIERNYRSSDCTTETATGRFFFSKSYFCRRFRAVFGLPFMIYLQNFRIQKAKQLDPADFPSYSALAASVGFPSYFHFVRVFRKSTGLSPRAYFEAVRRSDLSLSGEDDAIEK